MRMIALFFVAVVFVSPAALTSRPAQVPGSASPSLIQLGKLRACESASAAFAVVYGTRSAAEH